ncbi:ADP-ribosyltransferase [Nocardia macrotermitis]|nr:ADP-ribosyltransferase [Nocardia macrotermitis]
MNWIRDGSMDVGQGIDYTELRPSQRRDATDILLGLHTDNDDLTQRNWIGWAQVALGDNAVHMPWDNSVELGNLPARAQVWMSGPRGANALGVERVANTADEFRVYNPDTGHIYAMNASSLQQWITRSGITDLVVRDPAQQTVTPRPSMTDAVQIALDSLSPTAIDAPPHVPGTEAEPDFFAGLRPNVESTEKALGDTPPADESREVPDVTTPAPGPSTGERRLARPTAYRPEMLGQAGRSTSPQREKQPIEPSRNFPVTLARATPRQRRGVPRPLGSRDPIALVDDTEQRIRSESPPSDPLMHNPYLVLVRQEHRFSSRSTWQLQLRPLNPYGDIVVGRPSGWLAMHWLLTGPPADGRPITYATITPEQRQQAIDMLLSTHADSDDQRQEQLVQWAQRNLDITNARHEVFVPQRTDLQALPTDARIWMISHGGLSALAAQRIGSTDQFLVYNDDSGYVERMTRTVMENTMAMYGITDLVFLDPASQPAVVAPSLNPSLVVPPTYQEAVEAGPLAPPPAYTDPSAPGGFQPSEHQSRHSTTTLTTTRPDGNVVRTSDGSTSDITPDIRTTNTPSGSTAYPTQAEHLPSTPLSSSPFDRGPPTDPTPTPDSPSTETAPAQDFFTGLRPDTAPTAPPRQPAPQQQPHTEGPHLAPATHPRTTPAPRTRNSRLDIGRLFSATKREPAPTAMIDGEQHHIQHDKQPNHHAMRDPHLYLLQQRNGSWEMRLGPTTPSRGRPVGRLGSWLALQRLIIEPPTNGQHFDYRTLTPEQRQQAIDMLLSTHADSDDQRRNQLVQWAQRSLGDNTRHAPFRPGQTNLRALLPADAPVWMIGDRGTNAFAVRRTGNTDQFLVYQPGATYDVQVDSATLEAQMYGITDLVILDPAHDTIPANCVPRVLQFTANRFIRRNGHAPFTPPTEPDHTTLPGTTGRELQTITGILHTIPNRDLITQHLRGRDGAQAIVIYQHTTTNHHGIGAHAVVYYNHNGNTYVHDPHLPGDDLTVEQYHNRTPPPHALAAATFTPDGTRDTIPGHTTDALTTLGNTRIGAKPKIKKETHAYHYLMLAAILEDKSNTAIAKAAKRYLGDDYAETSTNAVKRSQTAQRIKLEVDVRESFDIDLNQAIVNAAVKQKWFTDEDIEQFRERINLIKSAQRVIPSIREPEPDTTTTTPAHWNPVTPGTHHPLIATAARIAGENNPQTMRKRLAAHLEANSHLYREYLTNDTYEEKNTDETGIYEQFIGTHEFDESTQFNTWLSEHRAQTLTNEITALRNTKEKYVDNHNRLRGHGNTPLILIAAINLTPNTNFTIQHPDHPQHHYRNTPNQPTIHIHHNNDTYHTGTKIELTKIELRYLPHLVDGHSDPKIAKIMNVTPINVNDSFGRLRKKVGIEPAHQAGRDALKTWAIQTGELARNTIDDNKYPTNPENTTAPNPNQIDGFEILRTTELARKLANKELPPGTHIHLATPSRADPLTTTASNDHIRATIDTLDHSQNNTVIIHTPATPTSTSTGTTPVHWNHVEPGTHHPLLATAARITNTDPQHIREKLAQHLHNNRNRYRDHITNNDLDHQRITQLTTYQKFLDIHPDNIATAAVMDANTQFETQLTRQRTQLLDKEIEALRNTEEDYVDNHNRLLGHGDTPLALIAAINLIDTANFTIEHPDTTRHHYHNKPNQPTIHIRHNNDNTYETGTTITLTKHEHTYLQHLVTEHTNKQTASPLQQDLQNTIPRAAVVSLNRLRQKVEISAELAALVTWAKQTGALNQSQLNPDTNYTTNPYTTNTGNNSATRAPPTRTNPPLEYAGNTHNINPDELVITQGKKVTLAEGETAILTAEQRTFVAYAALGYKSGAIAEALRSTGHPDYVGIKAKSAQGMLASINKLLGVTNLPANNRHPELVRLAKQLEVVTDGDLDRLRAHGAGPENNPHPSDGSTPHPRTNTTGPSRKRKRTPDTTIASSSTTHPTNQPTPTPTTNCAPQTLHFGVNHFQNNGHTPDNIHIKRPTPNHTTTINNTLNGMTGQNYATLAGPLQTLPARFLITDYLENTLGPGSLALTIYQHHTTNNHHTIGAHAIAYYNHNGTIKVYDPATHHPNDDHPTATDYHTHHPEPPTLAAALYTPHAKHTTIPGHTTDALTTLGNTLIGAPETTTPTQPTTPQWEQDFTTIDHTLGLTITEPMDYTTENTAPSVRSDETGPLTHPRLAPESGAPSTNLDTGSASAHVASRPRRVRAPRHGASRSNTTSKLWKRSPAYLYLLYVAILDKPTNKDIVEAVQKYGSRNVPIKWHTQPKDITISIVKTALWALRDQLIPSVPGGKRSRSRHGHAYEGLVDAAKARNLITDREIEEFRRQINIGDGSTAHPHAEAAVTSEQTYPTIREPEPDTTTTTPARWNRVDPGAHHSLIAAAARIAAEDDPNQMRRRLADHLRENFSYYYLLITNDILDGKVEDRPGVHQEFLDTHPDQSPTAPDHLEQFTPGLVERMRRILTDEIAALHTTDSRYIDNQYRLTGHGNTPLVLVAAMHLAPKTNFTVEHPDHTQHHYRNTPDQPTIHIRHDRNGTYYTGTTITLNDYERAYLSHLVAGESNEKIVETFRQSGDPDPKFARATLESLGFAHHDLRTRAGTATTYTAGHTDLITWAKQTGELTRSDTGDTALDAPGDTNAPTAGRAHGFEAVHIDELSRRLAHNELPPGTRIHLSTPGEPHHWTTATAAANALIRETLGTLDRTQITAILIHTPATPTSTNTTRTPPVNWKHVAPGTHPSPLLATAARAAGYDDPRQMRRRLVEHLENNRDRYRERITNDSLDAKRIAELARHQTLPVTADTPQPETWFAEERDRILEDEITALRDLDAPYADTGTHLLGHGDTPLVLVATAELMRTANVTIEHPDGTRHHYHNKPDQPTIHIRHNQNNYYTGTSIKLNEDQRTFLPYLVAGYTDQEIVTMLHELDDPDNPEYEHVTEWVVRNRFKELRKKVGIQLIRNAGRAALVTWAKQTGTVPQNNTDEFDLPTPTQDTADEPMTIAPTEDTTEPTPQLDDLTLPDNAIITLDHTDNSMNIALPHDFHIPTEIISMHFDGEPMNIDEFSTLPAEFSPFPTGFLTMDTEWPGIFSPFTIPNTPTYNFDYTTNLDTTATRAPPHNTDTTTGIPATEDEFSEVFDDFFNSDLPDDITIDPSELDAYFGPDNPAPAADTSTPDTSNPIPDTTNTPTPTTHQAQAADTPDRTAPALHADQIDLDPSAREPITASNDQPTAQSDRDTVTVPAGHVLIEGDQRTYLLYTAGYTSSAAIAKALEKHDPPLHTEAGTVNDSLAELQLRLGLTPNTGPAGLQYLLMAAGQRAAPTFSEAENALVERLTERLDPDTFVFTHDKKITLPGGKEYTATAHQRTVVLYAAAEYGSDLAIKNALQNTGASEYVNITESAVGSVISKVRKNLKNLASLESSTRPDLGKMAADLGMFTYGDIAEVRARRIGAGSRSDGSIPTVRDTPIANNQRTYLLYVFAGYKSGKDIAKAIRQKTKSKHPHAAEVNNSLKGLQKRLGINQDLSPQGLADLVAIAGSRAAQEITPAEIRDSTSSSDGSTPHRDTHIPTTNTLGKRKHTPDHIPTASFPTAPNPTPTTSQVQTVGAFEAPHPPADLVRRLAPTEGARVRDISILNNQRTYLRYVTAGYKSGIDIAKAIRQKTNSKYPTRTDVDQSLKALQKRLGIDQDLSPQGLAKLVAAARSRATQEITEAEIAAIPRPNCAPLAMQFTEKHFIDRKTQPPFTTPTENEHNPLTGMTGQKFQTIIGTPLQTVDAQKRADITNLLNRLGDGALALVIDQYTTGNNELGIGAHTTVYYNDKGTIKVHDPATTGPDIPFTDYTPPPTRAIATAVFTPEGNRDTIPEHPPTGLITLGNTLIGAPPDADTPTDQAPASAAGDITGPPASTVNTEDPVEAFFMLDDAAATPTPTHTDAPEPDPNDHPQPREPSPTTTMEDLDAPEPVRWDMLPDNGNQLFEALARWEGHIGAQRVRRLLADRMHELFEERYDEYSATLRSILNATPHLQQIRQSDQDRRAHADAQYHAGKLSDEAWDNEAVVREKFEDELEHWRRTDLRRLIELLRNPHAPTDHLLGLLIPLTALASGLSIIVQHPDGTSDVYPDRTDHTHPDRTPDAVLGRFNPPFLLLHASADDTPRLSLAMDADGIGPANLDNPEAFPTRPATETTDDTMDLDEPTTPTEFDSLRTNFGHDILEKLGFELPDGTTDPERTQLDETIPAPPTQRPTQFPPPGIPVMMPRPSLPLAGEILTLVALDGTGHHLQITGAAKAKFLPDKDVYRVQFDANGNELDLPAALADQDEGFTFTPPDPTAEFGTLTWDVPYGQTRFIGTDVTGAEKALHVAHGRTIVARPGPGTSRWLKAPEDPTWVRVEAHELVLPRLPQLIDRSGEDLYGPSGEPQPEDVGQGAAGDCALLTNLKAKATVDKQAIRDILHDNNDGTVSVRFRVKSPASTKDELIWEYIWVPVHKSIYVHPGTDIGYFAYHQTGKPLWPSIIEKAYAMRFGGGNDYHGLNTGAPAGVVAAILGKGFHQAPTSYNTYDPAQGEVVEIKQPGRAQPVRTVNDGTFLHPLRFDMYTLHNLVSDFLTRERVHSDRTQNDMPAADFEFARTIADSFEHWHQEAMPKYEAAKQRINTIPKENKAAIDAAWAEYDRTESITTPAGFRGYLDRRYPNQWDDEKRALTEYFKTTQEGPPEHRILPTHLAAAAHAIAERIDHALQRGTTVIVGTHPFGAGRENKTAVPGLIGDHAYTAVNVERDANRTPIWILIENPWNHNRRLPTPIPGIQLRLDPGGNNYHPDGHGGHYRIARDGTRYITRKDGTQERHDPDHNIYRYSPDTTRYHRAPDGTIQQHNPDGSHYRKDRDQTEYWTHKNRTTKYIRQPGQPPRLDPTRIDPPDTTFPRRGGIIALAPEHVTKLENLYMSGPGAHALYGPQDPVVVRTNTKYLDTGGFGEESSSQGTSAMPRAPTNTTHTDTPAGGTLAALTTASPNDTPADATAPQPTPTVVASEEQTVFGDHLDQQLSTNPVPVTDTPPQRPEFPKTFDWSLLKPKPLDVGERLENLSREDKDKKFPKLPLPVELPGPKAPGGDRILTLLDYAGDAHRFYNSGSMHVTVGEIPGKGLHYRYQGPTGLMTYLPTALLDITTHFRPDAPGSTTGMLHWNLPGGQTRIAGISSATGTPTIRTVPAGTPVIATPRNSTSRWIKLPGEQDWIAVTGGNEVIPALPRLIDLHDHPLFHISKDGTPEIHPEDLQQRGANTCSLLAPLKVMVNDHPQAILDMLTDYKDGTAGVRFFIDGKPEWVRVEKQRWDSPHSVHHEVGKPIWAVMIEKAFLQRFVASDGYSAAGFPPGMVLERLGREYYEAGTGTPRPTPVGSERVLHPFRLGPNELRKLLGPNADSQFIDEFPGHYEHWHAQANARRAADYQRLQQVHQGGLALELAWNRYQQSEERNAAAVFQRYLNDVLPAKWQAEKAAVTDYHRQVTSGGRLGALQSDVQKTAATAFLRRIEYLLKRGATVLIDTHAFGPGVENATMVPGLYGKHTYAVLGLEYDPHTGEPVRLILENPHDDNHRFRWTIPGIELRLDPGGTGYIDDNGVRYRHDSARDITYFRVGDPRTGRGPGERLHDIVTDFFTPAGATEYRRAPDNTIIGLSANGERYTRTPEGIEHRVMRDHQAWRLPDRTEYHLLPSGSVLEKVPGRNPRIHEPGTFHAWPTVPTPKRTGIVAVGLEHMSKFYMITANGPGAYAAGLRAHTGGQPNSTGATPPTTLAPGAPRTSAPATPPPATAEPQQSPDNPTPQWVPLTNAGNRVFEALSRLSGHLTASDARRRVAQQMRQHTVEFNGLFDPPQLGVIYRRETVRRAAVEKDHDAGNLTSEQWDAELQQRQQFNQQFHQYRQIGYFHLANVLDNPQMDTDGLATLVLPIAARALALNLIVLHPKTARGLHQHGASDAPFALLHIDPENPEHTLIATEPDGTLFTIAPEQLHSPAAFALPPGHTPLPPISTGLDAHGPGIGHLNLDGIRVFDTTAAGVNFGETRMARWHELTPEQQHAVWAYDRRPIPNGTLRNPDAELQLGLDRFAAVLAMKRLLTELTGSDQLSLAALTSWYQRGETAVGQAIPDPTRASATWQKLRALLESPDPERALRVIEENSVHAEQYQKIYQRYLGLPARSTSVRRQIELLDEATRRPIPLTEPIEVQRGLFETTFLLASDGEPLGDRDPALLAGTVQTEPGYLSTAVDRHLIIMPAGQKFTAWLSLIVPVGAHGLWIGSRSNVPDANELLFPRGTRYRITTLMRHPATGVLLINADILLPPGDTESQDGHLPESSGPQPPPWLPSTESR